VARTAGHLLVGLVDEDWGRRYGPTPPPMPHVADCWWSTTNRRSWTPSAGSCGSSGRRSYGGTVHEALASARDFLPDLMLPDGDGFEVMRRLRADGLPHAVVFLTARDTRKDLVGGLTEGGDDYDHPIRCCAWATWNWTPASTPCAAPARRSTCHPPSSASCAV
jgi:CheY-like chemotaxis protein